MSSQGEKEIISILDKLLVTYCMQFTFKDCRDKRCLPFDFLIIVGGKVGVIEYDGGQHFTVTPKFHGNDSSKAAVKFAKQVKHDIYKNTYTKQNNICLLRISYKESDHILKYVTEFITAMKSSSKRIDMFSNTELYPNPYGESKSFFGKLFTLWN
jgi:hypothetical protein